MADGINYHEIRKQIQRLAGMEGDCVDGIIGPRTLSGIQRLYDKVFKAEEKTRKLTEHIFDLQAEIEELKINNNQTIVVNYPPEKPE